MELGLSLGDKPKPFSFLEKSKSIILDKDLGFCMAIGGNDGNCRETGRFNYEGKRRGVSSSDPPVQLDLLPFSPVHRGTQPSRNKSPSPWFNEKLVVEPGRVLEVNRRGEEVDSAISSFKMDFSMFRNGKRDSQGINKTSMISINESDIDVGGGGSSRGSDDYDEENGMSSRKKLRLTKQQSAFLEESFKEHNTLNPRQKVALAKQLNLRPRQVEVWFQNRRARTKLKQTEVDCEYLKRCCETLTAENRRLTKELQELRALKTSQPFYKQLPATTLTMCPSCERVSAIAPNKTI